MYSQKHQRLDYFRQYFLDYVDWNSKVIDTLDAAIIQQFPVELETSLKV